MVWLLLIALLVIAVLVKKIVELKKDHAVVNELVLLGNRSLDLSETLNTALEGLLELLEMDSGAVHLYSGENAKMVMYFQKGYPPSLAEKISSIPLQGAAGLIPRAVHEKRPIFLDDITREKSSPYLQVSLEHGYRSAACVPLFANGEPVATLLVSSRRSLRFRQRKIQLLENFGQTMGLALKKARLHQQVIQDKQRFAVLCDITKIINSSLDLPAIFQRFAREIKILIDYDRCLVALPENEGKDVSVFLLATPHKTSLPDGITMATAGTSLEWVLKHKKVQFEKDLEKERLFKEDETLYKEGIRSAVRVPIWANEEIIGVFILNSKTPNCYTEQDLQVLEPVAEQLAFSLEKYFLFQQVTRLSMTDELTGCGNRRMLRQEMEREIPRADRYGRTLAMLMLDIDHFKQVNDTYGHVAGDHILRDLSRLICDNVRDIDLCIRYGGEEFLVILPETDLDGAVAVAEKIRLLVEQSVFSAGESEHRITVSVGIAVYPKHAITADELIERADSALYQAKKNGRNRSYAAEEGTVSLQSLF
ncbi:GGDEF domain-containing protein [Dethiobacter alkaliphilus]|uniref:GGDEF domain-containing protein n=1 Tax=Dethiobacter alkaliphilus TaxID=427926 RepID=UPI00222615E0|nr:diguanylate cyclase [Dethiobacter alkaliphilus]MCW3490419.1 diguanylate cyclase [Dethiobacter alkaliphilus]